jgi:hypothetical protein
VKQQSKGLVHFAVAAVILGSSWIAFDQAVNGMGWFLNKEPIEWPKPVAIDKDFNLVVRHGPQTNDNYNGLPDLLANRYEFVEPLVMAQGKETVLGISDDDKETLGIGDATDQGRVAQRRSNWLFSGYY